MLETWVYVLAKTEKGELVALNFLEMSAGFDTIAHLYLLRKMETDTGMGGSLWGEECQQLCRGIILTSSLRQDCRRC